MTDVLVGVTLPQFTDDRERFVDGAQRAENLGLDSVWLFDHMWPLSGGKTRPVIECWTGLAWLASATKRMGIGTLVTRSSLRHPALLAKMTATVGTIAPGRVTIAIGSGDEMSKAENEAFGFPYFAEEERIAQLASTVDVVRRYFEDDRVSVANEFVSIEDLPPSPYPSPRPKVWVAGRSDDVLEFAGRSADGWNGWGGTPRRFAEDAASLAVYAEGRAVEPTWGGLIALGESDDAARAKMAGRDARGFIVGGPQTVAKRLNEFVEAGARHLIATFPDPWRPGVYETFASQVVPLLS